MYCVLHTGLLADVNPLGHMLIPFVRRSCKVDCMRQESAHAQTIVIPMSIDKPSHNHNLWFSGRPTHSWNGAELMSLLRKATRSRQAGNLLFGSDFLHHPKGEEFREEEWDGWSQQDLLEKEREGLEVLLKKTEALQLSQTEQDRSRLIPVAEKMVELGADISATDNEVVGLIPAGNTAGKCAFKL